MIRSGRRWGVLGVWIAAACGRAEVAVAPSPEPTPTPTLQARVEAPLAAVPPVSSSPATPPVTATRLALGSAAPVCPVSTGATATATATATASSGGR